MITAACSGNRVVNIFSSIAHVHWALQVQPATLVWLTAIAAALTSAGLIGFQRRDIG